MIWFFWFSTGSSRLQKKIANLPSSARKKSPKIKNSHKLLLSNHLRQGFFQMLKK
jgi:hypothetical protein